MLGKLKKEKGRSVDLLLFVKWDRFSRNAGDAYQMTNILRKICIEPQAVEHPLVGSALGRVRPYYGNVHCSAYRIQAGNSTGQ